MELPRTQPVTQVQQITYPYTFYYTNLCFDIFRLRYKADLLIYDQNEQQTTPTTSTPTTTTAATLSSKTPLQIIISDSWEYKFMSGDGTKVDLTKIVNWNRVLLINFTTKELKNYMHLIKHCVSNFIDERNIELVGWAAERSLELMSQHLVYRPNFLEKFYSPYNLYLNNMNFNNDNTIYTRDESILTYANGKLFDNKFFEIDVMKNALQNLYRHQHRLVYYSSTRKLDCILDTLLQEQYRLNVLFNINANAPDESNCTKNLLAGEADNFRRATTTTTTSTIDNLIKQKLMSTVYVPNVYIPNLNISLHRYIKWELYRMNRMKTTKNWVPFINTQNILTHKFKHFIGVQQQNYIPLSYNCLKTSFNFLIV